MMAPDSRTRVRHEIRTLLNHIVGYADILLEDAAGRRESGLQAAFVELREKALSLREPLLHFFANPGEGSPAEEDRESLKRRIYGLLYDAIAQIQAAKRACQSADLSVYLPDLQKILEAANGTAELFEGALAHSFDTEGLSEETLADIEESAGLSRLTGSILVVDDDGFNREILTRHLERQGHTVYQASDGAAALEALDQGSYDLVLLDVMMPGMNGYQFLERVKSIPNFRDIHIIVISALEESGSVAHCLRLGAEDYLPREFDPVVLRARIESCLERNRLRARERLSLQAVAAAQRRLAAELRRAADYVRGLLPRRVRWRELRTDWIFLPSRDLGGDAFGYTRLDDGRIALYLLDVSGHGIEAALLSVSILNRIHSQSRSEPELWDPVRILSDLNAAYRSEDQNCLYFSAWFGLWDPDSRRLRYASAGAPPAALIPSEGALRRLCTEGPAVGVDEGTPYECAETEIPRNSVLYLFSDGIYEVRRSDEGILGLDRFLDILAEFTRGAGSLGVEGVVEAVKAACGRTQFEDDVSLAGFYFDA